MPYERHSSHLDRSGNICCRVRQHRAARPCAATLTRAVNVRLNAFKFGMQIFRERGLVVQEDKLARHAEWSRRVGKSSTYPLALHPSTGWFIQHVMARCRRSADDPSVSIDLQYNHRTQVGKEHSYSRY